MYVIITKLEDIDMYSYNFLADFEYFTVLLYRCSGYPHVKRVCVRVEVIIAAVFLKHLSPSPLS